VVADSAYGVAMPDATATPAPLRMRVIDPDVIRHFLKHPARGEAWTLRELAETLGCSIGTISHISTGKRSTVPTELADRFAEAVGVETATLFTPVLAKKSATIPHQAVKP
jgi:DNA-binding Xre family transcriptional regulator